MLDDSQLEKSFGPNTLKSISDVRLVLDDVLLEEGYGTYGFSLQNDNQTYVLVYFDYGTMINTLDSSIENSILLMVVLVISLSLLNAFVYSFLFARPIKRLSKLSTDMANLNFDVKCPENSNDEIGDLARNLNSMSSALAEKIAQLQDEIERVRELEKQKEVFFAAASHELKTPVTILEGNIRGMIEGIEPYDNHEEYLSRSLRTVKRMESLINEILTASKMQSSSDITMIDTDMNVLLKEKLEELKDLFEIRNIVVSLDLEEELIFIGNKELTSLAIGAFISNAVLYSTENSNIDIRSYKDNGMIVCEICNSNAHIDDDVISHLFEPFYRSDYSRNRNSGGSGLGLYIAQLIISKENGMCSLTNSADGVIATIKFPSI